MTSSNLPPTTPDTDASPAPTDYSSGVTPVLELSDSESINYVLTKLANELPTLFEKDLTYDIYTSDIYFKDPVNTFKYKFNYRIIFWTLRFHGQLFFSDLHFDLHRVWQDQPDLILADWTVRGTLRLPWKPDLLFNGRSHYHLNEEDKIYKHIDVWDRSPKEILKQFWWRK